MLRKIWKTIYQSGLRKSYADIDPLQYLKRLVRGVKSPKDTWCYSDKDMCQYSKGEVLIKHDFKGAPVFFYCDPEIHAERTLISRGSYDLELLNLIYKLAGTSGMVLDIGANIGALSIPLAKSAPGLEVHAFEPAPNALHRLKRNLSINPVPNLVLVEKGAGDKPGTLHMNAFPHKDLGQSTFSEFYLAQENPESVPVEVVTLDQAYQHSDTPIKVIKIDVQGFEVRVLRGASDLIQKHRPYLVLEHEDLLFPDPASASHAKMKLAEYFKAHAYKAFYITRYGLPLIFPVNWERSLNGNLLAIPVDQTIKP